MKHIYIVRKHPIIFGYRGGVLKAFTIHTTHATRAEAKSVADEVNKKSEKYRYMVGKVELKETAFDKATKGEAK
jgi:hypothetical protein